jgi:hypothetical protein
MALEGDFEAHVATAKTVKLAAEYNARRSPGDPMMTESGIVFGPGDIPGVIDEPNYEKSLEASAAIFGGDKEGYRDPEMTQERWEAAGNPADLGAIPLPSVRVAQNQIQTVIDNSFTSHFFKQLDATPACCLEALGNATESLALLERDLFRKADETLDEARVAAHAPGGDSLGRAGVLTGIANAYRHLAQAAS